MAQEVHVAVIDDEPSVLESFKMILKIKDYIVDTYPDGPSALKGFQKGKYDLAFVDYKLPVMDGLEVLRKIKEIDQDCEVIIVTAYATDASHANAITLGALEYLRKPFMMEEIYELAERALKRRRMKGVKKEGGAQPLPPIH